MVAAATAALAIAGCGGSSDSGSSLSNSEYAQKLKQVFVPLGSSLQRLGAEAQSATSKKQLETAIQGGEKAVQTTINGVGALDAPSAATQSNQDIIDALDSYEGSLADLQKTVRSGTPQEIHAGVGTFRADSEATRNKLQQIAGELKSEGVKFGGG
jgi:hypothetical protein